MKFSTVKTELAGVFWQDHLSIDKRLIESNQCPNKRCREFLTYRGFSNQTEYRAYGVCERCDYAKLFWTETAAAATAKKSFIIVRAGK